MKDINCFLLTLLLLFINTDYLFSQWEQTNGPYGGHITCLAANENYLIAGTRNDGIFLSDINGASWTEINTGLITYRLFLYKTVFFIPVLKAVAFFAFLTKVRAGWRSQEKQ